MYPRLNTPVDLFTISDLDCKMAEKKCTVRAHENIMSINAQCKSVTVTCISFQIGTAMSLWLWARHQPIIGIYQSMNLCVGIHRIMLEKLNPSGDKSMFVSATQVYLSQGS